MKMTKENALLSAFIRVIVQSLLVYLYHPLRRKSCVLCARSSEFVRFCNLIGTVNRGAQEIGEQGKSVYILHPFTYKVCLVSSWAGK